MVLALVCFWSLGVKTDSGGSPAIAPQLGNAAKFGLILQSPVKPLTLVISRQGLRSPSHDVFLGGLPTQSLCSGRSLPGASSNPKILHVLNHSFFNNSFFNN
jgi:hypothetical protein